MSNLSILSVIILGIVQGIAEFLPISSSAHLIIFRDVFGFASGITSDLEFTFDIALHFGTLLAIGIFFFKDFILMIKNGFTKGVKDKEGKILWYLVVATIPAGVFGILFEDKVESVIRDNYVVIAIALIVMGIVIYLADKFSKNTRNIEKMTFKDAIIIGCSQVFALIPGFSRSGTTIAAARVLGIERENAAKFSFYLSAPVVCGAVVLQLFKKSTWDIILTNLLPFVLGIFVSFLVGLLCIKYLLKFLKKHDFKAFMIYRIILAIIVLILVL